MYDAVLLLSFGGPEGPDDVMPFLENVTRGRGVPRERLLAVAEHYEHFGGVSPINQINRDLVAGLEAEFAAHDVDLPVYWGNRNWHPMVEETVERMRSDGVRRALVFATSAYGGYSACLQYHEDIARARAAVGEGAPELEKLRHFFDHPLFVAANADAVRRALAELGTAGESARLVFTAHSVPLSQDAVAGAEGHLYTRQLAEAARLIAAEVGVDDWDLVWQSRSGPPRVPWLEPDVRDHLDDLHAKGVPAVVVSPIGFVSDHLEVVWDLDTEAKEHAELGMAFARAASAGTDPRFTELVRRLVQERQDGTGPQALSTFPVAGVGVNGTPCAPGCCGSAR